MKKLFILDTNVLLFDPRSIFKFDEHDVYIPMICVEELDRFKREQNENGRNARMFSRLVDELRVKGSLSKGVELESGGKLFIYTETLAKGGIRSLGATESNDNMILGAAITLIEKMKDKKDHQVIVISKDINLRLKADALNIKSEDFGVKKTNLDEVYTGYKKIQVSRSDFKSFEDKRFLNLANYTEHDFFPNEYLIITEENNDQKRSLGRYHLGKKGMVPLINFRDGVWGIYPKNIEQHFALDALLNNEIKLVSLMGKAGTGKTLLAIAAGLELTISQEHYTRILISRPVQPLGKDIGYLPGDIDEKLTPWMQPIYDNLDFLFGQTNQSSGKNEQGESWSYLLDKGLLHIEPLTYIRGRSIPAQFLIVDEAQNLSPHEIKTIITRAGDGTKVILTGDNEQIDNPYLDSLSNGLSYCVDRLKNEEIISHVTLKMGERSVLSEIAAKCL